MGIIRLREEEILKVKSKTSSHPEVDLNHSKMMPKQMRGPEAATNDMVNEGLEPECQVWLRRGKNGSAGARGGRCGRRGIMRLGRMDAGS